MLTVDVVETRGLGDRSYVVSDGEVAVVVDPQRDIDRFLDILDRRGVRLTHVLETHVHNDYVTGGHHLARARAARYVGAAGDGVEVDRHAVRDGDSIDTGTLRVGVLHTPGHTPHHLSYVLADADGTVEAVFTGGSMLFGATGRTDLEDAARTDELTRAQYHSVRRIADLLPGDAAVYPTHGFGSFCSATPTSGSASTLAEQRDTNPALTLEEQKYVDTLLAGLNAYPAYYAHMAPINRSGPPPLNLPPPARVDLDTVRRRAAAGEWVVDMRSRRAFAAGHLPDTLNIEAGEQFATYLGWLYAWGAPLTLIGGNPGEIAEMQLALARIGIDHLGGVGTDDPTVHAEARTHRVGDFAGLRDALRTGSAIGDDGVHVLDTRRREEWERDHVRGARNVPVHELLERRDEIPLGEVWVYCGSGYRATIAASIIDAPDREVVLLDGSFEDARRLGLTD